MKKLSTTDPSRAIRLNRETIVKLTTDQLRQVAGGNTSTRKSQCPTLCFTL